MHAFTVALRAHVLRAQAHLHVITHMNLLQWLGPAPMPPSKLQNASTTVNVTFAVSDPTVAAVTPASVLFTSSNYSQLAIVSMKAVDNAVADGTRSAIVNTDVVSADPTWDAVVAPTIAMTILDNDIVSPLRASAIHASGSHAFGQP